MGELDIRRCGIVSLELCVRRCDFGGGFLVGRGSATALPLPARGVACTAAAAAKATAAICPADFGLMVGNSIVIALDAAAPTRHLSRLLFPWLALAVETDHFAGHGARQSFLPPGGPADLSARAPGGRSTPFVSHAHAAERGRAYSHTCRRGGWQSADGKEQIWEID